MDGESAAALDLGAFLSIIPRSVGGHDFTFTLQNYAVSLEDDFRCNRELRFIWKFKGKVGGLCFSECELWSRLSRLCLSRILEGSSQRLPVTILPTGPPYHSLSNDGPTAC